VTAVGLERVVARWIDGLERSWMSRRRGEPAPGTRLIEAGGATFRIRVVEPIGGAGTGAPTIVLAPDPPNVIEHLAALTAALSRRHRVVCVELPGFGFSTAPPGHDYSGRANTRVLGALLDQLGLAPYALGLPCLAGLTGCALAIARPDQISHVIAIQAPGVEGALAWADRVDPRGMLRRPGVGQAVVLATRRKLARSWFRTALADRSQTDDYVAITDAAYARGATYPLASALQGLTRPRRPLPRPSQPVLAVWGGNDRTHRTTQRDELYPGATLVVLDSAGHFPELEDVTGFTAAVDAFL
jgi:pimeloyl-ACP methyl ester carboxylesterase